MGLFRRKSNPPAVDPNEHAVIIHLPLSDDEFGAEEEREAIFALEDRIEQAAVEAGGEFDGNEFGAGEAVLFSYGPDADRLFDAIQPQLERFGLRTGAYAIKRYGGAGVPDAREERVDLA